MAVNFVIGNFHQTASRVGCFIKIPSAPSGDTTVWDYNFGSSGYFRLRLATDRKLYLEFSFLGHSGSADITNNNPLAPNQWYWINAAVTDQEGTADTNWPYAVQGKVWAPGGGSGGFVYSGYWDTFGPNTTTFTAQLGIGVSLTSGYANFPNSAGWEMKDFYQHTYDATFGPLDGPPTSDPAGGNVLYTARQTVGSASQLTDFSGNSLHGTPGPLGLTINLDGPFAT